MRVLAVAVLAALAMAASATVTKIPAATEECYRESAPPGANMSVAFIVTHGGKLDIDARVTARYYTGPNTFDLQEKVLQQWTGAMDGQAFFDVPAPADGGKPRPAHLILCLSNKMAKWTPKWVDLEFHRVMPQEQEGDDGVNGPHNKDFADQEHRLHAMGNELFELQTRMIEVKRVEQEHRDVVESTNATLFYGAIVNGLLLALMAGFQFWYLKRFLTVRSSVRPL